MFNSILDMTRLFDALNSTKKFFCRKWMEPEKQLLVVVNKVVSANPNPSPPVPCQLHHKLDIVAMQLQLRGQKSEYSIHIRVHPAPTNFALKGRVRINTARGVMKIKRSFRVYTGIPVSTVLLMCIYKVSR